MTNRERFLAALNFERPDDRLPAIEWASWWDKTLERWHAEGLEQGLSADASHPVQQAWAELDVVQCGYCQSGQIMAAAALLAEKPKPTDPEIDAALGRQLCRCGTYQRVRAAVHRAAELNQEQKS